MPLIQEDPSVRKERKIGFSLAGGASIIFHLTLFLLIGGTVVVERILPKTVMVGEVNEEETAMDNSAPETPPEEVPPETSPSDTDAGAAAAANPEPSTFDVTPITVDSVSPAFATPTLIAATATVTEATGSSNQAGISPGASAKRPINLFGAKAEAGNLGVILDCSGSALTYLVATFKEVDKNFENAPTVLTNGCGVGPSRNPTKIELFGSLQPDKDRDRLGASTIQGQLLWALGRDKSGDLAKELNQLKKRKNVWAVNGEDVLETGSAFDQLIKQDVDTIYWFTDFADPLDPTAFGKIIDELKERKIKVIIHNFTGEKTGDLPLKMAKETGGIAISKKPPNEK